MDVEAISMALLVLVIIGGLNPQLNMPVVWKPGGMFSMDISLKKVLSPIFLIILLLPLA